MSTRDRRILVVDDDPEMARAVAEGLADHGFEARAVASSEEAARLLADESYQALVTDLRMPRLDGLGLLEISRRIAPDRPVIVMTAFSAIDSAIASIRQGAFHYLTKPFKTEELALFIERALESVAVRKEAMRLKRAMREELTFGTVVARSAAMSQTVDVLQRIANTDVPVLLLGETGTGKGLLARVLHAESNRRDGPFVTVNCAALPDNLLESELFGHTRGAFTGAATHRDGLVAEAHRGTLFLDEIGETSLPLQAKLLDVVERRVVRPIGSNRETAVDVRLVVATHRDLHERVREGAFREDLLYRLEVVPIEVPPLRQRREDIPMLAEHFVRSARARYPQAPGERVGPAAMKVLIEAAWPGNVRALRHVIERAMLLAQRPELEPADFAALQASASEVSAGFGSEVLPMKALQRRYAEWALERLGGRKMLACEKLDIDPKTLNKLLAPE